MTVLESGKLSVQFGELGEYVGTYSALVGVGGVYKEVVREQLGQLLSHLKKRTVTVPARRFYEELHDNSSVKPWFVFLNDFNARYPLVAYGELHLHFRADETTGYIENIIRDPEEKYRRKGIGEHVVRNLLNEARMRGATKVQLTSRLDRQAAHAIYLKIGFNKITGGRDIFEFKFD